METKGIELERERGKGIHAKNIIIPILINSTHFHNRHVFHVASHLKVDIDDINTEKKLFHRERVVYPRQNCKSWVGSQHQLGGHLWAVTGPRSINHVVPAKIVSGGYPLHSTLTSWLLSKVGSVHIDALSHCSNIDKRRIVVVREIFAYSITSFVCMLVC